MAIEAGIKLIGEIRDEEYGSLLTFEDPDGHWLEIYQNNTI
jgi:metallothiol transferase